jgi:hypothetical protein
LANGSKAVVISPTNTLQVSQMIPADGTVTSEKLDTNINIAGSLTVGSLQSTTRPTTSDTGTLTPTSLITTADADKRLFPIEGLFTNAYKVPLTNTLGGFNGLAAFAINSSTDQTQSFTSTAVLNSYATWTTSFTRCANSGVQLVLPEGIGLCAKVSVGSTGQRRAKLLLGGLTSAAVLGAGVLDARGFGVEIESNPALSTQIRFRTIYRNHLSQTLVGDWTNYISTGQLYSLTIWVYKQSGQIKAAYKTVIFTSITRSAWNIIPPVNVTTGDDSQTNITRMKTFQIALEANGSNVYGDLSEIYETHNIFPNI